MSPATAGCMSAQVPQQAAAEMQTTAQGAFQHLPPMPSRARQTAAPVKTLLAPPKPIVVHARAFPSRQCAIPLLNVNPDDSIRYTLRKMVPQIGQPGAMVYVTTAPTCGDAAGDPIKK
jgi:hypothetical protein